METALWGIRLGLNPRGNDFESPSVMLQTNCSCPTPIQTRACGCLEQTVIHFQYYTLILERLLLSLMLLLACVARVRVQLRVETVPFTGLRWCAGRFIVFGRW